MAYPPYHDDQSGLDRCYVAVRPLGLATLSPPTLHPPMLRRAPASAPASKPLPSASPLDRHSGNVPPVQVHPGFPPLMPAPIAWRRTRPVPRLPFSGSLQILSLCPRLVQGNVARAQQRTARLGLVVALAVPHHRAVAGHRLPPRADPSAAPVSPCTPPWLHRS